MFGFFSIFRFGIWNWKGPDCIAIVIISAKCMIGVCGWVCVFGWFELVCFTSLVCAGEKWSELPRSNLNKSKWQTFETFNAVRFQCHCLDGKIYGQKLDQLLKKYGQNKCKYGQSSNGWIGYFFIFFFVILINCFAFSLGGLTFYNRI